ncbi:I78 family peptidase inhibitor [Acinetobacter thermotolerans]|uniref:I78 family peptidase inhibitor n=1 Tax=Acinetobacter thermotolerans TaxID=3151487 RepID=UPI00325C02EC
MKKLMCLGVLVTALTGCAAQPQEEKAPKVDMPNPASAFCIEQGGKLEIHNEVDGQVGYCHLPDGKVIEEWAFYRSHQDICLSEAAHSLIGQSGLSEAKIKDKTKAKVVRMVQPGQPVTMDFREDRVTVTTDPKTGKIVQATCG